MSDPRDPMVVTITDPLTYTAQSFKSLAYDYARVLGVDHKIVHQKLYSWGAIFGGQWGTITLMKREVVVHLLDALGSQWLIDHKAAEFFSAVDSDYIVMDLKKPLET